MTGMRIADPKVVTVQMVHGLLCLVNNQFAHFLKGYFTGTIWVKKSWDILHMQLAKYINTHWSIMFCQSFTEWGNF